MYIIWSKFHLLLWNLVLSLRYQNFFKCSEAIDLKLLIMSIILVIYLNLHYCFSWELKIPNIKYKNLGVPGWLSRLCLTFDFSSGHDLMVHEFKPHVGLHTGSVEPAWDSLSLSLSISLSLSPTLGPTCTLSVSLKINK